MENYFSLFDISPAFDLDLRKLNAKYRELALAFHPDKFVNADSTSQRQAVQKSTQLNEAYKTLKNPVTRAAYLLNTHFLAPLNQSFVMEQYHVTDTELLMEQIEYREQLAQISKGEQLEQLTDFQQRLKKLIAQTKARINQDFESLAKMLAGSLEEKQEEQQEEQQQVDENTLTDLKNQICELRFLEKLNQDADELEEQLLEHL